MFILLTSIFSFRPTSTWACPYGRMQTGKIDDANTIIFGDLVGGKKNPMIFPFDHWPVTKDNINKFYMLNK